MTKMDIGSRSDIVGLVDSFYEKVRVDDQIGPLFSHVDWPAHLPVMYDFWSSMFFGDQSYRGNPFQKHIPLNLTSYHFGRWMELFERTVKEQFSGPHAEEIVSRAKNIGNVWQHKLNILL